MDWRDSPTVRGVRAWEHRDDGEKVMSLEDFISLNYNAAIRLYQTGRMRLLTEDATYLKGEATALDATVLLLQRQLSRKPDAELSPAARNHREVREGVRKPHKREAPYKGIGRNGRKWSAYGRTPEKHIYLGIFATAREAALAYDVWAREHGRQTNADLGLL